VTAVANDFCPHVSYDITRPWNSRSDHAVKKSSFMMLFLRGVHRFLHTCKYLFLSDQSFFGFYSCSEINVQVL